MPGLTNKQLVDAYTVINNHYSQIAALAGDKTNITPEDLRLAQASSSKILTPAEKLKLQPFSNQLATSVGYWKSISNTVNVAGQATPYALSKPEVVSLLGAANRRIVSSIGVSSTGASSTPIIDRAIRGLEGFLLNRAADPLAGGAGALLWSLRHWKKNYNIDVLDTMFFRKLGDGHIREVLTPLPATVRARGMWNASRGTISYSRNMLPDALRRTMYHEMLHSQQTAGGLAKALLNSRSDAEIMRLDRALGASSLILKSVPTLRGNTVAAARLRLEQVLTISIYEQYPAYLSKVHPDAISHSSPRLSQGADLLLDIMRDKMPGAQVDVGRGSMVNLSELVKNDRVKALQLFHIRGATARIHLNGRYSNWGLAVMQTWFEKLQRASGAERLALRKLMTTATTYTVITARVNEGLKRSGGVGRVVYEPLPLSSKAKDGFAFESKVLDRIGAIEAHPALASIDLSTVESIDRVIASDRKILGGAASAAQHAAAADRLELLQELKNLAAVQTELADGSSMVAERLGLNAADDALIASRSQAFLESLKAVSRASIRGAGKAASIVAEPLQVALTVAEMVYRLEVNDPKGAARAVASLVTWPRDLAAALNPGAIVGRNAYVFPDKIEDWKKKDFLAIFTTDPNPALTFGSPGMAIALNFLQLAGSGLYSVSLPLMKRLAVAPQAATPEQVLLYGFLPQAKVGKSVAPQMLKRAIETGLLSGDQLEALTRLATTQDAPTFAKSLASRVNWLGKDAQGRPGWRAWVANAVKAYESQTLLNRKPGIETSTLVKALEALNGANPVPSYIVNVLMPMSVSKFTGFDEFKYSKLERFDFSHLDRFLAAFELVPSTPGSRQFRPTAKPNVQGEWLTTKAERDYIWARFRNGSQMQRGDGVAHQYFDWFAGMQDLKSDFSTLVEYWLGIKDESKQTAMQALASPSGVAAMKAVDSVLGIKPPRKASAGDKLTRAQFEQVMNKLVFKRGSIGLRGVNADPNLRRVAGQNFQRNEAAPEIRRL